MATITLLGEPKSTNTVWRSTCRNGYACVYMSPEGRRLKESYSEQARSQWGDGKPLSGPLSVSVAAYLGTRRLIDIDNLHKLSFDSLSGIAWEDDRQICRMEVVRLFDRERPRIEISVSPELSTR